MEDLKYKLKIDGRKFFDKKYHTSNYDLRTWKEIGIPIELLDEVEKVWLTYGQKTSESGSSLSGWGDNQSHYQFTVYVDDVKYRNHDKVNIAEVMDKIQKVLDSYFKGVY